MMINDTSIVSHPVIPSLHPFSLKYSHITPHAQKHIETSSTSLTVSLTLLLPHCSRWFSVKAQWRGRDWHQYPLNKQRDLVYNGDIKEHVELHSKLVCRIMRNDKEDPLTGVAAPSLNMPVPGADGWI